MAACCALAALIIYNLVKVHDNLLNLDDSSRKDKSNITSLTQSAGDGDPTSSVKYCRITLSGLTCSTCVKAVRDACQTVPGVSDVTVSLHSLTLRATYHSSSDPVPSLLVTAVEKAGYQAISILPDDDWKSQWVTSMQSRDKDLSYWSRSFRASAIASGILAAIEAGERISPFTFQKAYPYVMTIKLSTVLAALYLLTGPIHREALGAALYMKPTSSLISSCGLITSLFASLQPTINDTRSSSLPPGADSGSFTLASVCLLMTVILGGRLLKSLVARRSSQLPSTLASAIPPTAHLLGIPKFNPLSETVPVELLQPGSHILVKSNERFPADGIIIHGTAWVLETIISGEMNPRPVGPGDAIYTGCTNNSGEVVVEVRKVGMETWLGQTLQAISQDDQPKLQLEGFSDRALSVFSAGVILLALFTGFFHVSAGAPFAVILRRVATVFLCACPCGLGLSVPTCVMAAISNAFQAGILLRPGPHIELMARSRTVIFDKTGTLTLGKLRVHAIHLETSWSRQECRTLLWKLVGILSQTSHHPVSKILSSESNTELSKAQIDSTQNDTYTLLSHEEHPGLGITGTIIADSTIFHLIIGNHRLHQRKSIYVEPECPSHDTTAVYLSINDHLAGRIELTDTIAPDALHLIHTLHARGFTTFLLTGDTAPSANAVASALNIPKANVHASLLPRDKSELIKKLQRQHGPVTMVGDGLNDAPALLAASCSVNIQHESASVSRPKSRSTFTSTTSTCPETDVQLVPLPCEPDGSTSLHRILYLIDLARATCTRMRRALYWSIGYNAVALLLASGMAVGVGDARLDLSPLTASMAMSVSSLLNLTYCLRLARWSPTARDGYI